MLFNNALWRIWLPVEVCQANKWGQLSICLVKPSAGIKIDAASCFVRNYGYMAIRTRSYIISWPCHWLTNTKIHWCTWIFSLIRKSWRSVWSCWNRWLRERVQPGQVFTDVYWWIAHFSLSQSAQRSNQLQHRVMWCVDVHLARWLFCLQLGQMNWVFNQFPRITAVTQIAEEIWK